MIRYRPANSEPEDPRLGRLVPDDEEHIRKFPFRFTAPASLEVNKTLRLPKWHWTHDQGREGSCVGHGIAMERAITNGLQAHATRRYDPIGIWQSAKAVDEWPDTNPGDENGTSVRAGYDVARDDGICRVKRMDLVNGTPTPIDLKPISKAEGVDVTRWARTVDEMRAALSRSLPVTIGINWYGNFDEPKKDGMWFWIGRGSLGRIRGGHCTCIYGASDRLQAFRMKNSWGREYPLVWLPYSTMERLLREDGEAALVTDR